MPVDNIPDRLQVVIDAYGADPNNWPTEDQQQFSSIDFNEVGLSRLRADASAIDRWLLESRVESRLDADEVAARVLAAKLGSRSMAYRATALTNDRGVIDRVVELLAGSFWRPVVAASMPLAIGMVLGATTLAPDPDWMMAEQFAFALVLEE